MKYSKILALAGSALLAFSCGDDDDSSSNSSPKIIIPTELTTNNPDFYPEDIMVANNKLYVSGFVNSTIKFFDLTKENPTLEEFIPGNDAFGQSWGLASDGKVLLNNLNNLSFATFSGEGAKLVQYDINTGKETGGWDLPNDGAVGQSVQIVNGKYYIGDFNTGTPRIIQVDPVANTVNANWATFTAKSPEDGGSGLGGMFYNGKDGFYTTQNGKLWFVPINNDMSGSIQEVTVEGLDTFDADGLAWDGDDTIYYATNDAGNGTLDQGTLYKVVLTNNTTGTGSIVKEGLRNPSGVWFLENEGSEYVIYAESQFGAGLIIEDVAPQLPFKITFMKL